MPNKRKRFIIGGFFFILVWILLLPSSITSAETDSIVPSTSFSYYPSIPFGQETIWKYHLNMSGGYPLVPHEFGQFTQYDWNSLDEDQNQTVSILRYFNPPAFPNETVYGFYHQELGFVLWIKELIDETGVVSLAQVGESTKGTYNANISPTENDYSGNIEWFFVNDKLYPRTWIKGHMVDGTNWTEYWGPFSLDEEGSVFRERRYTVNSVPITIQNKQYDGFAISMTGPGEDDESVEVTETLFFADGIGPTRRDIVAKTTQVTPLPPFEGWPTTIPADTIIFDHSARIVSVSGL